MITTNDMLSAVAAHAERADGQLVWPTASWEALSAAGVPGWSIPAEHGGAGCDGAALLEGYAALAGACLTTAFILSQREAAVRRILDHGSPALQRELLRPLACGGQFATVGLSQLTTSRQHGGPALRAALTAGALTVDGVIPWVTGAAEAQHIIIGAVLDDGRQVLAVLPMDRPGVTVGPPLELMALRGSLTAEVHCANVRLEPRWLLAGPAERVMAGGRGGTGGLETSCLALGLTAAAVTHLQREAAHRPELADVAAHLHHDHAALWQELLQRAGQGGTPEQAAALRAGANSLVLRATQAALTASKGAGFLLSHPAQRWARHALFFLVWSCPRPAADATLAWLAPGQTCEL